MKTHIKTTSGIVSIILMAAMLFSMGTSVIAESSIPSDVPMEMERKISCWH